MRVVVITRHGGPEVLQVEERPSPVAAPGQVRIEVAAAGVNFADTLARVGLYEDAPEPPCVVGYEVAGTVAEVGDGVSRRRRRRPRDGGHEVRQATPRRSSSRGRRDRARRTS